MPVALLVDLAVALGVLMVPIALPFVLGNLRFTDEERHLIHELEHDLGVDR